MDKACSLVELSDHCKKLRLLQRSKFAGLIHGERQRDATGTGSRCTRRLDKARSLVSLEATTGRSSEQLGEESSRDVISRESRRDATGRGTRVVVRVDL